MLFLFQHGMEVIGFTSGEVTSLFQLIASILKLGNIDFSHRSNDDGTDGCDLSNTAGKTMSNINGLLGNNIFTHPLALKIL